MGIKKSVKAKIKKEKEQILKEMNFVVKNALKNYDFLSTLIIDNDPEKTYHNIMDYREAVESMLEEINGDKEDETKKGEA